MSLYDGHAPSSVRRRPPFQRSSPLKPLGQSRSIPRKGERKFIYGPGHMTKMAAMTINSK